MNLAIVTTAVIAGLMLAEWRVSAQHEVRLRARGAIVPPGDVYVWLRIVYPAAFILMGVESVWRASAAGPSVAEHPGPAWFASGLLMFVAAKVLKFWAIGTLGERWTFHVMFLPNAPLVAGGPYRYLKHPNYVAVVGELVGTAMMVGAPVTGVVMLAINGVVLWGRIRFEDQVLRRMALSAQPAGGKLSEGTR